MTDPTHEQELVRRRLLGFAPVCPPILPGQHHGRDLVLISKPGGLDLAQVDGIDALGQSLSIALTTGLGTDLFNTSFGFDGLRVLAEESHPGIARERVRIAVVQVLRQDARVRRILDIELGDGAYGALAAGQRELAVRVGFETVAGERVNVDLGTVVTHG